MEKNLLSNGKIIFPNKLFIKKKINIGIIGSGKIAHEYARVINSFKHKITVIVSSSINKDAKKLAKKYRSKIYRDISEIDNSIKIDAWIVCTSSYVVNMGNSNFCPTIMRILACPTTPVVLLL